MTRSHARRARRPFALPAVVAVALVLAATAALPAAAAETRTLEKTFTAPAGERLRLANLVGSLELVAGDGDRVRVVAEIHAEGRNAGQTEELLRSIEWVRDGGPGEWALSYPVDEFRSFRFPPEQGRGLFWGSRTNTRYLGERVTISKSGPLLYADVTVTYPARVPLAVRQVVGPVRGGDLYGDLVVDTGSGYVKLGSFNGTLNVDTGSGDIEVGAFRGDEAVFDTGSGDVLVRQVDARRLEADTGSGEVTVRDGRVEDLVADTGSGDVRVDGVAVVTAELDTGSGDVLLRGDLSGATRVVADTGSGDVEIYGGPDASFRVSADQGSGDLRVLYDDAELIRDDGEVVGALRGDRRTRIDIDTGSGDAVVGP